MPVFRGFLIAAAIACAGVFLAGCGKTKETVKTAKEDPKTTTRIPPMPGK